MLLLVGMTAGYNRAEVLQEFYPSQVQYGKSSHGKEVMLVTDSQDEVTIIGDGIPTLISS